MRKAGGDEVADPGEAGEGFGLASELGSETGHLGEGAGGEGGEGVVSELEAGADSGGEAVDVFDSAAELDANEVGGGVGAEGFGANWFWRSLANFSSAAPMTAQAGRPREISSA